MCVVLYTESPTFNLCCRGHRRVRIAFLGILLVYGSVSQSVYSLDKVTAELICQISYTKSAHFQIYPTNTVLGLDLDIVNQIINIKISYLSSIELCIGELGERLTNGAMVEE